MYRQPLFLMQHISSIVIYNHYLDSKTMISLFNKSYYLWVLKVSDVYSTVNTKKECIL